MSPNTKSRPPASFAGISATAVTAGGPPAEADGVERPHADRLVVLGDREEGPFTVAQLEGFEGPVRRLCFNDLVRRCGTCRAVAAVSTAALAAFSLVCRIRFRGARWSVARRVGSVRTAFPPRG